MQSKLGYETDYKEKRWEKIISKQCIMRIVLSNEDDAASMYSLRLTHWNLGTHVSVNRPIPQIPQCTSPISHNAPFCNRNVHMRAHFCNKMMHAWDICNALWDLRVGCNMGQHFSPCNGVSLVRHKAITWTNTELATGPLEIIFREMWIKTRNFLGRKCVWKCHGQKVDYFVQISRWHFGG